MENESCSSEATLRIVACEHSIVTETFSPKNGLITSPNVVSDGGISFQGNRTTNFFERGHPKQLQLCGISDENTDRDNKKFKNQLKEESFVKAFTNSACQTQTSQPLKENKINRDYALVGPASSMPELDRF